MLNEILRRMAIILMKLIKEYYLHFIALVGIAIIVAAFTTYVHKFSGPLSDNQEVWGLFGDFMGGTLNPILAFLSLIALLITIRIQSNELKATRLELELTRSTIEAQTSIQDAQREQLEKQFFDNHFFNTLDLYLTNIRNLDTSIQRSSCSTGLRDCLYDMFEAIKVHTPTDFISEEKSTFRKYSDFWSEHSHVATGFYTFTLTILNDIEESNDPSRYIRKMLPLLSADHRTLLFFIGMMFMDSGQVLMKRYSMFEGIKYETTLKKYFDAMYSDNQNPIT
jgi:uncharacterized membrane protein